MNAEFLKLLKNAKRGDITSLEKILKKTEKDVYSFLYYMTDSDVELSDIVQDVLLKVAKGIKSIKDEKHFRPWLNKIVIRNYYDQLRKNKTQKEQNQSLDISEEKNLSIFTDNKTCPVDDCINNELMNVIKQSIMKLNEPYKEAIVMRELEGMSYDEIAKLTKTSVGTVKSRISRARNRLKEYMKPYME